MTEETLEMKNDILKAINDRFDSLEKDIAERFRKVDAQLEVVREGIVHNDARFDRLEAIALDAKSIALTARSQLTS